jgi:hypothetical protein
MFLWTSNKVIHVAITLSSSSSFSTSNRVFCNGRGRTPKPITNETFKKQFVVPDVLTQVGAFKAPLNLLKN